MTYKRFIGELPDWVTPLEAESRWKAYEREHADEVHREFWKANKEEARLRSAFDPRRLESAFELRREAAAAAAISFDPAAALVPEPGDACSEAAEARWVHHAVAAAALIASLDAEKGVQAPATVREAAAAREAGASRRGVRACAAYLWQVHGVDYFGGEELPAAEFRSRLARSPAPQPASAAGEAWEAAAGRLCGAGRASEAQQLGKERVEAATEAFLENNTVLKEAEKCAEGAECCGARR